VLADTGVSLVGFADVAPIPTFTSIPPLDKSLITVKMVIKYK
jgi:hypothetical protein